MSQGLITTGLAGITDMTCAKILQLKDSGYGLLNPALAPALFVSGAVCQYAGAAYGQVQYGSIPDDVVNKGLPSPSAPETIEQMTVAGAWTPEQSAPDYAGFILAAQREIETDTSLDQYNPDGNLPTTAVFLDTYKWWMIGGAVALLVFVESKRPRY